MQTEHEDQVTEDQDVAAATEVEQVDEQPVDNGDSPDTDAADEPETFDRDYVERLRRENGRYGSAPSGPTTTPNASMSRSSGPPAGWPTRATCS